MYRLLPLINTARKLSECMVKISMENFLDEKGNGLLLTYSYNSDFEKRNQPFRQSDM